MQALVNAFVRGLKWMQTHSADEIAAVMPEEYALGDKALYVQSIKSSLPMYSPRRPLQPRGRGDRLRVLKEFDPRSRPPGSTSVQPTPTRSSTRRKSCAASLKL